MSGTLAGSGDAWTFDGKPLDLGDVDPTAAAKYDYDKDGTVESLQEELAGLTGSPVSLLVKSGTLSVYGIGDLPFRNADGSLAHP